MMNRALAVLFGAALVLAYVGGEWRGRRESRDPVTGWSQKITKIAYEVERGELSQCDAEKLQREQDLTVARRTTHADEFASCVRADSREPGANGSWVARFYCANRPANWAPFPCGYDLPAAVDNGPCYCNGKPCP